MQEAPWTKTRYESASEESAPASGPGRASWRRGVALAGIAALLLETIVALMQAPRTEPLRDPGVSTLDWWRYPIERNAIQRMPRARGPLSVVQITRDGGTDQVWFAGAGGLIIHSRDGDRTWDSTTVSAVPQHASAAPLPPQKAAPLPAQNPAPRISPRQPARQPVVSGRLLKKANLRGRTRPSGATRISLVSFDQQAPVQQKASPVQQYDPKSQASRLPMVAVPNVIGQRWQDAEKALFGASLVVRLSYTPVSDSSRANQIVSQNPAAGTSVRRGSTALIAVGRYVPPPKPQAVDTSRSSDSSKVATPVPQPADSAKFFPRLTALCFTGFGQGWAVGERGAAFRSVDGGATWTQVMTGIDQDFTSLACSAGVGAIAGSAAGTMWLHADGVSVEMRERDIAPPRWLHLFRDTLWAEGWNAPRRYSADTGRTWSAVSDGNGVVVTPDSARRLRVDSAGIVSTSTDEGRTWTRRANCSIDGAPSRLTVTDVFSGSAPPIRTWLALTSSGQLLRTDDDWSTCVRVMNFGKGSSPQIMSTRGGVLYAVNGGVYRSTDGGHTWHLLITTSHFGSLLFRDSLHGVVGVEDGHLAVTSDGGRSWTLRERVDQRAGAQRITRFGSSGLMLMADSGLAITSSDEGRTWSARRFPDSITPLVFRDTANGWGIDDDGLMAATTDGGLNWQRQAIPTDALSGLAALVARSNMAPPQVVPAAFLSGANGRTSEIWLATETRQLLHYIGSQWDTVATTTPPIAVSPVTSRYLYGLDTLGALVRSTDGGRAWSAVPAAPPRKYPAPWYYALAMLTVAGTLATARARRPAKEEAEESIADILVSDRPLREGDRDVLDFGKIAAGLSRFIRNTRTEPPLTIAVTGPWGTGKSSLMNLLRRDLQRRGFRTIWFNAWHHQREESLLASLLEAVRLTATPPVWIPRGVRFRARLLARRFHRYRAALVLLPVFAFAVGYILKDPARRWHDLSEGVESIMRAFGSNAQAAGSSTASTAPRAVADSVSAAHDSSSNAPRKTLLALIISIAGTIFTYMKGLKAFGVEPGKVAKSVASAGRVRTIESQPAFRYRFAQDFGEVTEALKPERIVIFVDDLDRCKPEQVLEILEAINFLVESGDCVVVLGIDRDRVTGCVAIGFKDVATVLAGVGPRLTAPAEPKPDIGTPAPPAKKDLDYQIEYAQHYLEKLLNMEIPIPPATPAGLGNVMTSSGETRDEKEDESTEAVEELRDRSRRRRNARLYAGIVAAASIVAFLWGTGRISRSAPAATPSEPSIVQAGVPVPDTTLTTPGTPPPTTPAPGGPIPNPSLREPSLLVSGVLPTTAWWVHVPLALLAMGTLLWLLTPREDNRVEDSAAFATALRAWAPVLFEEHPTPRSAKKFLNKMRFLSMAQRMPAVPRAPIESIFQRLARALGGSVPDDAPEEPQDVLPPDAIPEVTLVSLNVIRDRYPEWLRDEKFWTRDLHEYVRERVNPVPPEIQEALEGLGQIETRLSMARHRDAWQRLELWVRDG